MNSIAELVPIADQNRPPPGWMLATIEELVGDGGVFVDGDWVESKDQDPEGGVRLIQLADIGDGVYRDKSARFLTHEKAIELGCTFLKKGDVLIARMPDPLGRACIFPGDSRPAVTVVDVAIVRSAAGEFDHRWLMYFVNAPGFRSIVASMQSGSTRKRISRGNLAKIALPVPPFDQQKQIVAEIEKQFSRLDEAIANLKRVKANLKRYKAAVLKAAVEGRLVETEAELARRYETGAQLLLRILETRRSQWKGKGKYKEPTAPDTTDLPELPEGWAWATTSQVLKEVKDGTHDTPKYYETGVPFITQKHVKTDGFVFDDFSRISLEDHEHFFKRSNAVRGDILVSMIGVNRGESCIVDRDEVFSIKNVGLLKPDHSTSSVKFIQYYLSSTLGQRLLLRGSKGGAQPFVGLMELRNWPMPLPPHEEQKRIVAEVDRRLSFIREVEAQVDANLKRAARLHKSVLAKAFKGGFDVTNNSASLSYGQNQ